MDSLSKTLGPERRAWNYWFEDGLPTIVGGLGCLFGGLSFFFAGGIRLLFFPLYGVIVLRHGAITEWVKMHLTYPRTGYLSPPSPTQDAPAAAGNLTALTLDAQPAPRPETAGNQRERTVRFAALLVLAMFAVLGLFAIANPAMYAVAGVSMAVILWMLNRRDVMLSWFVIGGIPLVGVALAIYAPEVKWPVQRVGYFLVGCGVLIIADGAITLARYLWRNPVASVPAE
jgi:hypothetical protein